MSIYIQYTISDFLFDLTGDNCRTPDDRSGVCLNIRNCEPLLNLLRTVRTDAGAYSYLRESLCGYDGADPVVSIHTCFAILHFKLLNYNGYLNNYITLTLKYSYFSFFFNGVWKHCINCLPSS